METSHTVVIGIVGVIALVISPLFLGRSLRAGGEGIEAFGTGIEGFHIDPGKTLMIRLTPDRLGKITFRCDLHPEVQGELYLLDVPVG